MYLSKLNFEFYLLNFLIFAKQFKLVHYFKYFFVFNQVISQKKIVIDLLKFFFSENCFKLNFLKTKFLSNKTSNFLYWSFKKNKSYKVKFSISNETIKDYKRQLKLIIKKNLNFSIFQLINNLNLHFNYWKNTFFPGEEIFFKFLNFYLYKLLWNYVIRRYPRKKKTWIYEKHWAFNKGKFVFMDLNTKSQFNFPFFFKNLNDLYCFPICLDFFENINKHVKLEIFFKRGENILFGQSKVLWKEQKGTCLKCKKPLYSLLFSNLNPTHYFNKKFQLKHSIMLLHQHCVR